MSTSKEMGKALKILKVIPVLAVVMLALELYAVGYLKGNWEQAYAVCAIILTVFLVALYRRYLSTVQQMLQISAELDSHFSKAIFDLPFATKEEASAGTEHRDLITPLTLHQHLCKEGIKPTLTEDEIERFCAEFIRPTHISEPGLGPLLTDNPPSVVPPAYMQLNQWAIDHSAGRPILTFRNCSVIEAEDAEFVLSLVRQAILGKGATNGQ